MDEEFLGKYTKSEITCTFDTETRQWKVVNRITHRRSRDGENWEEKNLQMQSYANDLETALVNTVYSIEAYLSKRNHDLFKELV